MDDQTGVGMKVSEQIANLRGVLPDVVDEPPKDLVFALFLLIDEITIEGDGEHEWYEWAAIISTTWCLVTKKHTWVHDHCGFWGHQYCMMCHTRKYPEIPSSCGEAKDLLKISEEEYALRKD